MAIAGAAAAVAVVGGVFAVWATENTAASPTVAPANVGEPSISGTPRVGQVLRTTRGNWTGTGPITYSYRWFRCEGRGAPDASDCRRITNAADNTYVLKEATPASASGRRSWRRTTTVRRARRPIRPASSHRPVRRIRRSRRLPVPPRSEAVCRRIAVNGQATSRSRTPSSGCVATRPATTAVRSRARPTASTSFARPIRAARSAFGSSRATTAARPRPSRTRRPWWAGAWGSIGGGLDVDSLKAAGDRLVVAQVQFSPNPVRSRTAPITARVRVTARGGKPVNGARVFMRGDAACRRGSDAEHGRRRLGDADPRAERAVPATAERLQRAVLREGVPRGRPGLGGIAGYRLVQVRLASGG